MTLLHEIDILLKMIERRIEEAPEPVKLYVAKLRIPVQLIKALIIEELKNGGERK